MFSLKGDGEVFGDFKTVLNATPRSVRAMGKGEHTQVLGATALIRFADGQDSKLGLQGGGWGWVTVLPYTFDL